MGEAFIANKDYSHARAELDAATRKSKDIGMQALLAQANYLMSLALRGSGDTSEAIHHQPEAVRLLEQMHNESKSDALYKRKDLEPIAQAAGRLPSN